MVGKRKLLVARKCGVANMRDQYAGTKFPTLEDTSQSPSKPHPSRNMYLSSLFMNALFPRNTAADHLDNIHPSYLEDIEKKAEILGRLLL